MRQLLNTLYVTKPRAYLHLDHDTVRVEVELRKLQNQKPELGSLMGHDGSAALSSPKPGAATPTHPFHTHEPKL